MTPRDAIDATARPILEYGRAWMMTSATSERAAALGLPAGFGFWVNGRAGVLGDVDADVAAAAIGFMGSDSVRKLWEARPDAVTPRDAALAYAEVAADWGRVALDGVDPASLVELETLARRVADAALPSVGLLFAGWRGLPVPADPAGALTVTLNVLREHRGGAHLSAVHAVGIGPAGAILAADDPVRGGPAGAERFGWSGPFPEPNAEARARAEEITTAICLPAYESALDEGELDRFATLMTMVRAAIEE